MKSQALQSPMWPLHTWRSTFRPRLLRCTSAIRRRAFAQSTALATTIRAESAAPSASTLARVEALLDRAWLLKRPDTQLQHIRGKAIAYDDGCGGSKGDSSGLAAGPGFWVVRDDLLHPVAGGNKLRKLDALLPQLRDAGATDIVTCGGLQSSHTAAVAALCVEVGLKAHLLVRGERPAVPTGIHLYARMFGCVSYIPRSEYADREAMFQTHAARVQEEGGKDSQVAVIREGGSDPGALLGMLRLAHFLAEESQLGRRTPCNFIVDCGTGVSATGLALAAVLLDVPWRVTGIMMAAPLEYYQEQAETLASAFTKQYSSEMGTEVSTDESSPVSVKGVGETWADRLPLQWVQRSSPRKFGKILPGEISACATVAREHGILLDPMWTLASWEMAHSLAASQQQTQEAVLEVGSASQAPENERVIMLMTGGGLGLHGLAQRWPDAF